MTDLQDRIAAAKAGDPYALGVIPSPLSTKDYTHTPSATPSPATYLSPAARKVPVLSQQGGTCVGNSLATSMMYLTYEQTQTVVGFIGEDIDARIIHTTDAAISPRDGLSELVNHGLSVQGTTYYPKAYATVDHTSVQAVKDAISAPNTIVTASCWLLSNFGSGGGQGVNNGTDFAPDIPGQNPWGYHELTFVGYQDEGVIFQNSWDDTWGDGGFGRFGWDYVTARLGECWAMTDDANNANNYVTDYVAPPVGAGRAVRRVGTAAVYIEYSNGLVWVQSLKQAYALGVDMGAVVDLPLTDKTWLQPVVGPDAPAQYR